MNTLTFCRWLLEKKLRSSGAIGDFARDVFADEDAPGVENTRAAWLSHLGFPSDLVREAFEQAWKAYEGAMKRSSKEPPLRTLTMQAIETPEGALQTPELRKK